MKRIYMTLGLVAALGTISFAQDADSIKAADLQIVMVSPPAATLPNPGPTDSITVAFTIKNLGPDNVTSTDTIKTWLDTRIFGDAVYNIQGIVMLGTPPLDIPAGTSSDTLSITIANGEDFFGGQPNPVSYPTDAKVCPLSLFSVTRNKVTSLTMTASMRKLTWLPKQFLTSLLPSPETT